MEGGRFSETLHRIAGCGATRRAVAHGLAGVGLGALLPHVAHAEIEDEAKRKRCAKLGKTCSRQKKCCNGLACRNGKCACTGGKTKCGARCRNVNTDKKNCGACGRRCGNGETCSDGFCVRPFGGPGANTGEFGNPTGLAVDAAGTRFVTDTDQDEIEAIRRDTRAFSFGSRGTGDGQFDAPQGITVSGEDVFVADTDNHRIQRFDRDGRHELSFGFFGGGENQFRNPSAVAVDSIDGESGSLYVADTNNHLIKRYNRNGFFLAAFGGFGTGRGKFDRPLGIATVRPKPTEVLVYVVDFGNNRVQIFDIDENVVGAFGGKVSGNGQFEGPRGVSVAPDGTVFVTDGGNDRVQQFTADGQFLRAFGSRGSAPGQFKTPHGIAVEADGTVHVADSGNDRIQTFKPVAAPASTGSKSARRSPSAGDGPGETKDDRRNDDTPSRAAADGGDEKGKKGGDA